MDRSREDLTVILSVGFPTRAVLVQEYQLPGDGSATSRVEQRTVRTSHITGVGFWTRTMGASAQIQQFEVIADGRTKLGPFTLPHATGIHYFPVDATAKRLRFNVLKSTGGNTGAVEVEALAGP